MGLLLSSATFRQIPFFFPLAERRRNAPTLWQRYRDWERGRVKAVSREAGVGSASLDAEHSQSIRQHWNRHSDYAIRAEQCHGRGSSRHNLVFGAAVQASDHDAAMRISGEAPGQRDHSVERRKPGTSSVHRHLGS
jgi:hypothetical protein